MWLLGDSHVGFEVVVVVECEVSLENKVMGKCYVVRDAWLEGLTDILASLKGLGKGFGKGEVNTTSIPTASTHVSPASADDAAASISHDTIYAYIASQSNGSQIKYEDINQIHEDDIEKMDIKWNMALLKFGDSYEAPQEESGTGSASESSAKKKGRTVAVTTKDMQKKRNDVKARTTLLLALRDEHQLIFSKYKTAQELWGAILKAFSGNEATKKTKKNQLKQQYGNFKAEGSETLEQTFNRLQAIVSHLEFM
nr:hypothetical protein [Tanacetum cinerariifolium]